MGHQAFDHSNWENSESPKQDKIRHSHRIEMKHLEKKKRDHDDWDEWDD